MNVGGKSRVCVCSQDSLVFLKQLRIRCVSAGAGRWFDVRRRREGRGGVRQHVRHGAIVGVQLLLDDVEHCR